MFTEFEHNVLIPEKTEGHKNKMSEHAIVWKIRDLTEPHAKVFLPASFGGKISTTP